MISRLALSLVAMSFAVSRVVVLVSSKSPTVSSAFLHNGVRRGQRWRPPFSSCRLLSSSSSSSSGVPPPETNLQSLERRILVLNDGNPMNVQSPKQVAVAVFGAPQKATKAVLEQAASSESILPDNKRLLAKLILEYRGLLQMQKRSASTSAVTIDDSEEIETTMPPPKSSTDSQNPKALNGAPILSGERRRVKPQISHEQHVESLFGRRDSKLDPYWKKPLLQLTRTTSRAMVAQLEPVHCPMGYNPNATPTTRGGRTTTTSTSASKRGTFLSYVRQQKSSYPQCVVLVRCGDFYETFGLDAILLCEHVGLNPMAGKARAGCPKGNIQATVDGLTQQGFSVAVYEEVGNASASNKLKNRVLTQVVSPANPTYLYNDWLLGSEHPSLEGLPPSRPCVGIVHTAAGYNLVEVSLEERSVEYSERMTAEAVACRLAAYPPADPLIYIPSPSEKSGFSASALPFLPTTRTSSVSPEGDLVESSLGGFRIRTKILSPELVPEPTPGVSDADRYIQTIVEMILQINEGQGKDESDSVKTELNYSDKKRPTVDDFFISMSSTATNPLYVETAMQLGLLQSPSIPPLSNYVLDDAAPTATRRFLQRYLLVPPPPNVAQSMAQLVKALTTQDCSLPPLTVTPLGKVLSLIRAGQASADVYGDLLQSLSAAATLLREDASLPIDAMLVLCRHESGLPAERDSLIERCEQASEVIEAVISTVYHAENYHHYHDENHDYVTQNPPYLSASFFERNESPWRGRVQPRIAKKAYENVQHAARRLCQAVKEDFIRGNKKNNMSLIVHDIINNMIALKKMPEMLSEKEIELFFHPKDRHHKIVRNRWTTSRVQDALVEYKDACTSASNTIETILSQLAQTLQEKGHVPAIVQAGHLNLALSAAFHHAVKATQLDWHLAETIEPTNDGNNNNAAQFVNLWPYWMDRSQAVANSFDLNGLFLLTAPNMSGKSTLMRSTAAAALLTICGFCAPLEEGSRIPRFDTLFLRGASADVPAEDKSAFGAEMEDIAALMRCCGSNSLIFVDELGRGTSPQDGTRLAGAVLEAMAKQEMCGIFATHLHDILELPLDRRDRIIKKRMAIELSKDDKYSYEWLYKLEDGVCTDSLALLTAARFGLPEEIIRRAEELKDCLPKRIQARSRDGDSEDFRNFADDAGDSGEPGPSSLPPTQRFSPQRNGKNDQYEADFQRAIALVEDLTGQSAISIPPRWNPPASFGNKSCVYVLELAHDPPRYYVGETDSLSDRLRNHRRVQKGPAWSQSRTLAVPFSSKTEARAWESRLIQKLTQSGYSMESITDGRKLRRF